MTTNPILRSLPLEEGTLYDLYRTEYTYKQGKKKSIKDHDKVPVRIRGTVEESFLPRENNKFKMYYFSIGHVVKYGSIVLDECLHVLEEDGSYYFEDDENTKYLLILPRLN